MSTVKHARPARRDGRPQADFEALPEPVEPRRDQTFQHKLEQFNPGVVQLDRHNRVVAFNDVALQILGPAASQTFGVHQDTLLGMDVLQLHPDKSREKLRLLLREDGTAACPVKSPPPMAMMINIPDRVLMIKVSKLIGAEGIVGTCMIFYDLTDVTTTPADRGDPLAARRPRLLLKIPVYRKNRVVLLDLKDIVRFEGGGHYTTIVTRDDRYLSNLSLTDLEARLDEQVYVRVHRSHIVNLHFAAELVRDGETIALAMGDRDRTQVPVSRARVARLKELLGFA
jgi:hypothetical protein